MTAVPISMQIHIGIFGRRNTGKSTLLNRIAGREVSITSHIPGTTADPVGTPVNLPPIGICRFTDTAGIDDPGELGGKRAGASMKTLDLTDVAILVTLPGEWGEPEEKITAEFHRRKIPFLIALNKSDIPSEFFCPALQEDTPCVSVSALNGVGIEELLQSLISIIPASLLNRKSVVGDLIDPGDMVIQVIPIDAEAPVGRLLQPQIMVTREIFDRGAVSVAVKETELENALKSLRKNPRLVVTDSQVFGFVSSIVPEDTMLTSYSVLFSRFKGDISALVQGALALNSLKDGDRVLMAEACVHHPIDNDIGRIQIPNRIKMYTGKDLHFDFVQGKDFPADLSSYSLVVHCGGCMINRKLFLQRIQKCREHNVPITNYGVILAYLADTLEKAVKPFQEIDRLAPALFRADTMPVGGKE